MVYQFHNMLILHADEEEEEDISIPAMEEEELEDAEAAIAVPVAVAAEVAEATIELIDPIELIESPSSSWCPSCRATRPIAALIGWIIFSTRGKSSKVRQ